MAKDMIGRLGERMDALGMKAGAVADAAGVGRSFVYDIVLGRSANPTTEKLAKVATVLQTTVDYLLHGVGPPGPGGADPQAALVPIPFIRLEASMGGGAVVEDESTSTHWYFPASWIGDELGSRPADLRLLRVRGDSMEPTLLNRDLVLMDLSRGSPTPAGIFVLDDGVGLVAKRLEHIPNSDPETVRIISDNPRYSAYERTAEEIRIVGRVVWYARDLA